MNITYKPCTKIDIDKIFELSKNLIDTYENINEINYEFVLKWIFNKINTQIHEYTCIYLDNIHVGYIHVINENEVEVDDFYIFEEVQNQGIGTSVLKTIINQSKKPIFLYVFIKNTKAVSLYKKLGFEIIENIKDSRYIMRVSK